MHAWVGGDSIGDRSDGDVVASDDNDHVTVIKVMTRTYSSSLIICYDPILRLNLELMLRAAPVQLLDDFTVTSSCTPVWAV